MAALNNCNFAWDGKGFEIEKLNWIEKYNSSSISEFTLLEYLNIECIYKS